MEDLNAVRIIMGREAALQTILRRERLDELQLPEALRARDRALFGPGLSPEETVRRIVRCVRDEGDAAVLRFNQALDFSAPASITVGRDEIDAAYDLVEPGLVNALRVAACELLCAAQGLEFHKPLRPARGVD